MIRGGRGGRAANRRGRAELSRAAGEYEDTHVVANVARWPRHTTPRAEKRAERRVAALFALSALFALAFVGTYVFWPNDYVSPSEPGYTYYALRTPVVGGTFGLAVLTMGLGLIAHIKSFLPEEVAVQQRHEGPSPEETRRTTAAQLAEIGESTNLGRRPLVRRSVFGAAGLFAVAAGMLGLGGFVRNPWRGGDHAALWVTGWKPVNGETVYLRTQTGVLGEIERVRPEDMRPGSMMTVFPFRESDRGEKDLLLAAERASDAPVMLIRLRPGTRVDERPGQEDFNYGDYYAFSKICTHLGCPASQYDSQNNVSLCPCHQSEFLITEAAKPVFGPATRPLPQLPITVNEEGYFVARGDFVEPVGPGFWDMRKR